MGQYWLTVNLDKREFIDAHKLGVGLKLGEQIGSGHGTPDALFILVAAMRERRGGGDFDWDSNYYGKERDFKNREHDTKGGPVIEDYNEVAKRTIGRWAGDRIAVVGDYAEDSDLPNSPIPASEIYGLCRDESEINPETGGEIVFHDISADVARVIEHEVGGTYSGDGWKEFSRGS